MVLVDKLGGVLALPSCGVVSACRMVRNRASHCLSDAWRALTSRRNSSRRVRSASSMVCEDVTVARRCELMFMQCLSRFDTAILWAWSLREPFTCAASACWSCNDANFQLSCDSQFLVAHILIGLLRLQAGRLELVLK